MGPRRFELGFARVVQGGVTCTIGEGCLFSENITIRCTDHHSIFDLDTGDQINKPAGVTIGRHVWVGQDCAIAKGVTIEDGAIIGARSLVVGHVGRAELWAGSPARRLRERVSWTLPHPVLDPVERDAVRAFLSNDTSGAESPEPTLRHFSRTGQDSDAARERQRADVGRSA